MHSYVKRRSVLDTGLGEGSSGIVGSKQLSGLDIGSGLDIIAWAWIYP
jgi:hypothetical protein